MKQLTGTGFVSNIKYAILVCMSLLLFNCVKTTVKENGHPQKQDQNKGLDGNPMKMNSAVFYLGTYTTGQSEGIYKYIFHQDGSFTAHGLVAKTSNPSYITHSDDKKYLLAVNEVDSYNGTGSVESFSISDMGLEFLNRRSSGGAHPCFVDINPAGFVLTANYSGGNVGLLKLEDEGQLSELLDVQQHSGSGTSDRQEAPHAHSSWFAPDGTSVISIDLGTNELWFSKLEDSAEKLVQSNPQKLAMEPGAGPRHLVFHPEGLWLYVLNELNSTVTLLHKDAEGAYQAKQSFSTLPADYSGDNTAADIRISSDGKFLYVSNRGHDSIAVFQVNFQEGALKLKGHKSCGGKGPRNFVFSPDENYLVIANQYSDNIVSLKRDKKTGMLRYKNQTSAPAPVCIDFLQ